MLEYKFDLQFLLEGQLLDEDYVGERIQTEVPGDCLLCVGDDALLKIHYHSNAPWKVLELCAGMGELYDIVVENMERQAQGLKG